MAICRVLDQKVNRRLAHFKGHQLAAMAKIALCGKAIAAPQVTVMSNVQAHGFYGRGAHLRRKGRIIISGKQKSILVEGVKLCIGLLNFRIAVCTA